MEKTLSEMGYSKSDRGEKARSKIRENPEIVKLDPEIAAYFKNAATINAVLRRVMELAQEVEQGRKEAA